ncbi:LysR family transcriptional regulator [Chondromyces crocatus]|uniref:LysR family transcriptional regulator n=1 Tax=Chondromyces crocatus TaxID=52 RepID=A0A0K1EKZ3_CHOCO|nr:LysR family transcriptional regulator [Chondromyces crocatus]AKT41496.1 LysR family transcriptional regulator [Chondromyces crocatus]
MDPWPNLRAFVRSVRAGSFSAAAREAGMTPSAFSKLVSKLEAQLGVRLVVRGGQGLALTSEGQELYERVRRAFDDLDEAMVRVTQATTPRGLLRASVPLDLGRAWVLPRLSAFAGAYPELELEVGLTDRYVDPLSEQVDVVVRVGHVDDGRLVLRRIGRLRRQFYAAPSYLEARGTPQTPEALAGHTGLAYVRNGLRVPWELPSGGRLLPRGPIAADSNETLRAAALDGLGIAHLPEIVAEEDVRRGRLVCLLSEFREEGLPIHIAFPQGRLLPPRVRAFVDFFSEAARSTLLV